MKDTMRSNCLLALVVVSMVATACGSSDSGGGGGSTGNVSALCASVCDKKAASQCPNEPSAAVCSQDCANHLGSAANTCPSAVTEYLTCALGTGSFSCTANGLAELHGCDAAQLAAEQCAICAADPQDEPCLACTKKNCCAQLQAFYADPHADDFRICMSSCTDDACRQDCASQYPATAAVAQCEQDHCPPFCTS
jgi:hypothetical protein